MVPGARSEEEFKQAIQQKVPPDVLNVLVADAKANSVDELFISARDGRPFVIFYGGKRPKGVATDLFAYEQSGIDGKRQVAFGLGYVSEVDDQRFDEIVPSASRPK
jgi:hypothetical protein